MFIMPTYELARQWHVFSHAPTRTWNLVTFSFLRLSSVYTFIVQQIHDNSNTYTFLILLRVLFLVVYHAIRLRM